MCCYYWWAQSVEFSFFGSVWNGVSAKYEASQYCSTRRCFLFASIFFLFFFCIYPYEHVLRGTEDRRRIYIYMRSFIVHRWRAIARAMATLLYARLSFVLRLFFLPFRIRNWVFKRLWLCLSFCLALVFVRRAVPLTLNNQ